MRASGIQPAPEDVPYELVETLAFDAVGRRTVTSGEFRLLRRNWNADPETGERHVVLYWFDGAPKEDFRSREEARLWCECAGIDFDREVLESD